MTETTFKVQLAELQTIRVVCQCGGIIEVPTAKLYSIDQTTKCPVCHKEFIAQQTNPGIFVALHEVLDRLSRHDFKLEFPSRIDTPAK